jgi:hypothetical protein
MNRSLDQEPAMTATVHTLPARRELAHRSSNGIDVTLFWSPTDDSLTVAVADESGPAFELEVEARDALEVFEHPYAYAAFRGLELLDAAA